jgi:hypothetical protein
MCGTIPPFPICQHVMVLSYAWDNFTFTLFYDTLPFAGVNNVIGDCE